MTDDTDDATLSATSPMYTIWTDDGIYTHLGDPPEFDEGVAVQTIMTVTRAMGAVDVYVAVRPDDSSTESPYGIAVEPSGVLIVTNKATGESLHVYGARGWASCDKWLTDWPRH